MSQSWPVQPLGEAVASMESRRYAGSASRAGLLMICSKRGALWSYYSPKDVTIVSDEAKTTYQWGARIGKHNFCGRCGCTTYTESPDWSTGEPDYDNPKLSINARLLDDFDLDKVPVEHIDGRNLW